MATDIELEVWSLDASSARRREELVDVAPGEFPLRIDAGVAYPIPFALTDASREKWRRFALVIHWRDGSGPHTREVLLRRGQTVS